MSESKPHRPSVSVIIPIYNVEPYIGDCARSLFRQTLRDIEYIFIDDASTDSSIDILNGVIEEFPDRKSQVNIIRHKENKGISYTRQEGIDQAKGQWLIHCDSDDVVDKDAYEKLLTVAIKYKADITICSYSLFGENEKGRIKWQGDGVISSAQMLLSLSRVIEPEMHGSLCNKLIRTELWGDTNLKHELSYCEDELALWELLIKHPDVKIYILPESLYNYRIRSNSLTMCRTEKRSAELLQLIDIFEKKRAEAQEEDKKAFNSKIVSFLYRYLNNNPDFSLFSKRFASYSDYININKSLNYLQRLHLREAIKGHKKISKIIGACNKIGIKIIKKLRN